MLFLFISFMLVIDSVESAGWVKRIGFFIAAVMIGVIGLLMVVMTDKPLVIQWLVAWMTRP